MTNEQFDPSGPPCGVNFSTMVYAVCPTVGSITLTIDSNRTIPYPQTCVNSDEDCSMDGSGWVRAGILATQLDASFESFQAADGACTVTAGPTPVAPQTPIASTGTIAVNGTMHTYDLSH